MAQFPARQVLATEQGFELVFVRFFSHTHLKLFGAFFLLVLFTFFAPDLLDAIAVDCWRALVLVLCCGDARSGSQSGESEQSKGGFHRLIFGCH